MVQVDCGAVFYYSQNQRMPTRDNGGIIGKALLLLLWLPAVCDSFSSPQRQYTTGAGSSNYFTVSSTNSSDVLFANLHLVASATAAAAVNTNDATMTTRLQMKANQESYSDNDASSSTNNGQPWRTLYGRLKQYVTLPVQRLGRFFRRTAWRRPPTAAVVMPTIETATHAMMKGVSTAAVELVSNKKTSSSSSNAVLPARSATASIDMSGTWDLIVTEEFKKEYDEYMQNMGVPFLARTVAMSVIGLTTEETVQTEKGRKLLLRSKNVKGVWERTLIASSGLEHGAAATTSQNNGSNSSTSPPPLEPILTPLKTADEEEVLGEAWWENNGTVHHSWLRGITKYGGGDFESIRYLENGGNILVCESIFHPKDKKRKKATITWKFQKHGTSS